jgi:hypothetical protein
LESNKDILHVALAYCTTDVELPLAREWALLVIRNACELDHEIITYLQSLKPQQLVVEDEFLRKMQADIRLDPSTGKLNFQKHNF